MNLDKRILKMLEKQKMLEYEHIKPQLKQNQDFYTDNSRTNISLIKTFKGKRILLECVGEMDLDDCLQLIEMLKELTEYFED